MTTKRTKSAPARKSAKKATTKTPAPRKRGKSKIAVYDATLAEQPAAETTPAPKRTRKAPTVPKEMRAPNDPRVAPGATLTRVYKGDEITVKVQDDGTFLYDSQTFRSISAVAKHITGYPAISGPVFFRLVEPKAAAKDGE
jgi:endonuclease YncB( thermonuclease family)